MRFDQIIEASLSKSSDDKYLDIVNDIIQNGNKTFLIGKNGDQGTFIANPGQRVRSRSDVLQGTVDGKPSNIKVNQIYKTQQMVGAVKGLDVADTEKKIANRGNTAEGILGAATLARLIKRPGADITIQDLKSIIDRLPPPTNITGGTIELQAKETNNPIVDKFKLTVKLPTKNYEDFKNVEKMLADAEMAGIIKNVIAYTNTTNTDRYAKMFELNGRPDEVAVISDGVSDMSGRKTDVLMIYINEKGERTVKHLNLSLKVGAVKQFGQVGSGSGTYPDDQSFDALKNMFVRFGVDIEPVRQNYKQSDSRIRAYIKAYNLATQQLKKALAGSDDDTEKAFLKKFINGIQYFGTRNEPDVKLLQFEKDAFFLLDFKKADQLLTRNKLDLDAKMDVGRTRSGVSVPRIVIYNKMNNKPFLTIRVKLEADSGYIRNYIEKESELKNLLIVRSSEQKEPTLSKEFIRSLKNTFAGLRASTPEIDRKINSLLRSMTIKQLKVIAKADINILSNVAKQELERIT